MPKAVPTPSSNTEALPQRQADEIEALTSILGGDFVSSTQLKTQAWGNTASAQPTFILTVRPDDDNYKESVWAKVEIRLPKRYPSIPLILSVPAAPREGETSELSQRHLHSLAAALKKRAAELATTGDEAIWEVYSCGAELTSAHNLVRDAEARERMMKEKLLRDEKVLPLSEQKLKREDEAELAKAMELEQRLEAERKENEEKAASLARLIAQREQALEAERERRRNGQMRSDEDDPEIVVPTLEDAVANMNLGSQPSAPSLASFPLPDGSVNLHLSFSLTSLDTPYPLDDRGETTAHFQVFPATPDRQNSSSISVKHIAVPLKRSTTEPAGIPRTLDRITISSPYYTTSRGRRKLAGMERELEAFTHVRHSALRPVEAYLLQKLEPGKTAAELENAHLLSILQAPAAADEIKLSNLLAIQPLPMTKIASLAHDLISALIELHNRNLLLKDLTLERVSLSKGQAIIDSSWLGSALEMNKGNAFQQDTDISDPWPPSWTVPELQTEVRYTRKSDAFVLGRILLLSFFGFPATKVYESPWEALKILENRNLDDTRFLKLMSRLLERNPRKRISASDSLSVVAEILSQPAEARASEPRESVSNLELGSSPPKASQMPSASRSFFSALARPLNSAASSRFISDFAPLAVLGKGAFGIVSKVRNRLDGGVYAVKRIKLDGGQGEGDEKTLREIGALARVNHPHITRYYAAWIEDADVGPMQDEASSTEASARVTATTSGDIGSMAPQMQARSFSLSFGPPKDSDFDDLNQTEEEDFLSHVGFQADSDDGSSSSDSENSDSDSYSNDDGENAGPAAIAARRARKSASRSRSRVLSRMRRESKPRMPVKPRWLYIQMELVDDVTLREIIERGNMSIEDCWRLLRQMLNALVHIHNLGIVHRDLKPSNILMCGPDIKVGDFGLATTLETVPVGNAGGGNTDLTLSMSAHLHSEEDSSHRHAFEASEDMTSDVGTALYTAPEIVARQGARYGYKVDMYSLGIVFFEMIASGRLYTTGMERVQLIRNLRLPTKGFPAAWPHSLSKERGVIDWLVDHLADRRPGPLELLQSDLLPPRLEDESVQETLRLVTDPSSVYHLQLLDALFSSKPEGDEEARDVTFDAGSDRQGSSLTNPREAVVIDFLRTVFLRHGAVELDSPLLMPPRSGLYQAKDGVNPVQLLDSTGQIVFLPRDHLVPFARTIARSENHRLKRFCIGPVYRDALLAGGQPMSILAANMDIIVGAGGKMPAAAEGECLACLEEVLGEVPGFKRDWVILINHGAILDLLLERIPVKQHTALLSAISSLTTINQPMSSSGQASAAASVRSRLMQQLSVSKSVLDEIEVYASITDTVESAYAKLDRLVPIDHRPALAKAIQAIVEVREAARTFGVPAERRFLLCPLMSNYSHFYKGSVFFQAAKAPSGSKERRGRSSGKRDVVASGGRYTSLISRFATPVSGAPPHGVGIQIAVSKLVHALSKDQEINDLKRPPDPWTPRRADVYVHSAPGMLDARMAICRELWAHGIRSDLSYEDDAVNESLLMVATRCKEEGFSYLVYAAPRSMKVRSLWRRGPEKDFGSTYDLVPWLLERVGPGGTFGAGAVSSNAAGGQSGEGTGDAIAPLGSTSSALQSDHDVLSSSNSLWNPNASFSGGSSRTTMMETQIVMPVPHHPRGGDHRQDRGNHGHSDRDRRVKLSSNHPIIHSATREAHRLAGSIAQGDVPVIAVDLRGPAFEDLCTAAMALCSSASSSVTDRSGGGGGGYSGSSSSFASSSSGGGGNQINTSSQKRREVIWRTFLDGLNNAEEREYARSIRGHVERAVEQQLAKIRDGSGGTGGMGVNDGSSSLSGGNLASSSADSALGLGGIGPSGSGLAGGGSTSGSGSSGGGGLLGNGIGGSVGGTNGPGNGGQILLFSIREKRMALVGVS